MSLVLVAERSDHDMPPKWDGRAVEWTPWQVINHSGEWHLPKEKCRCGSVAKRASCLGKVQPVDGETATDYRSTQLPSGRSYGRKVTVSAVARWHLFAERCPDCSLDTVYDQDTDKAWELDASDYGDGGSVV